MLLPQVHLTQQINFFSLSYMMQQNAQTKSSHTTDADQPDWQLAVAVLLGGLIASALLYRAPFLAHDWRYWFVGARSGSQYAPWIADIVLVPFTQWMPIDTSVALLHGFTLSTVMILAFWEAGKAHPDSLKTRWLAVFFVVLAPYIYALLWLGQIEVVSLLGLAFLPFGIPLLFAKPHIAVWVLLTNRRTMLIAAGFLLLTLILFPLWPLDLLGSTVTLRIQERHPLAMGWSDTTPLIIPIALMMLLFTNRDKYRLMAAGVLLSPFIMPYHFYLLLPAIGRVKGYRQIGLWIASLLSVPSFTMDGLFPMIGYLHPILLWWLLAPDLSLKAIATDEDALIRRAMRFGNAAVGWVQRRIVARSGPPSKKPL